MPDPFAMALAALHASPLAIDALYDPDGAALPIRVIRSQATADGRLGDARLLLSGDVISIMRRDVLDPEEGTQILLYVPDPVSGDPVPALFELVGDPSLDAEGISWECQIQPVS